MTTAVAPSEPALAALSNIDNDGASLARVLLVDDEPVTRLKLRRLLESQGCEVVEASDGLEALRIARAESFGLCLLDVSMPRFDGFQTLRFLRQLYDQADLPVVIMTASSDRDDVVRAFNNGASDYLGKPIDPQVAIARIRNQLLIRDAQQALKRSEQRYALATRGTNDGMWDWDLVTGELYLSPRWRAMVGIESADWSPSGSEWMQLIHEEDRGRAVAELESHLCGETEHFETEVRIRGRDQSYRWMLCRGVATRDNKGIASRIAGSLTDITEGKVADSLTGLPNRMLFRDRLERSVEAFKRSPTKVFAVIYLDIDDFKSINDHFGHEAGDEFLVGVARRLEAAVRSHEAVIARLGGDEFAVLVECQRGRIDAEAAAKRLHERVYKPLMIGGREVLTRGSMGIAVARTPNDDSPLTADVMLAQADAAMYHAKKQTDVAYSFFREEMLAENTTRMELGNDLRHAIARQELSLHFQPLVSIADRSTLGFEALVRWNHPSRGPVPPGVFIPIAETNGLIVDIGRWVINQACRQSAQWRETYGRDTGISVNVSVRQLTLNEFSDTVSQAIQESGLPPDLLKLEVTESLLMQDPESTIALLARLRERGVEIGIDDFGTGYSSLAYLHQMPLDVLKIDRSFVSQITHSDKHVSIVRSIVALARSLDLRVVAEGVETEDQLHRLAELGADIVQGFLFSPPVPADAAEAFIAKVW